MGEIRYLATRDLLKEDVVERIVAAARANAGLWLMVKERAVEKRAIKAELKRRGADANDLDRLFAELAEELVSAMFENCPPEIGSRAQLALLKAAECELDGGSAQP